MSSGTNHTFTGLAANASYTFYVRGKYSSGYYDSHTNWKSISATTALTSTSLTLNWGY